VCVLLCRVCLVETLGGGYSGVMSLRVCSLSEYFFCRRGLKTLKVALICVKGQPIVAFLLAVF
jgi:hypothetical protein